MSNLIPFLQVGSVIISVLAIIFSAGVIYALITGRDKGYRREYRENQMKKMQRLSEEYSKLNKQVEDDLNNGIKRTKGFDLP